MDLSGSLVMELGNLEGNFGIVELGLVNRRGCSVARLYVSTIGNNTLVIRRRNLVRWMIIWVNRRCTWVIEGRTLVKWILDVWINGGSILVIGMTRLRVARLVGLWGRPGMTLRI